MPYKEWAENHIARIKGVLDGARAEHTHAVKDRIDEVGQMKDVVSLTEGLFAISKVCRSIPLPSGAHHTHTLRTFLVSVQGTAQLEADAFVRCQRVALAAEVKSVLDSWVRFEQQEKENGQTRLVKSVVDPSRCLVKSSESLKGEQQAVNNELVSMKKQWQEGARQLLGDIVVLMGTANPLNHQMRDAKERAEQSHEVWCFSNASSTFLFLALMFLC
jgi:F-type H+-transporting ATPase subunit b